MDPIRYGRLDSGINRARDRITPTAGKPSAPAKDALKITAFAEALRAFESSSSADAIVDSSKVTDVHQALASGTYEVDTMRLAGKFFEFEIQLYGNHR